MNKSLEFLQSSFKALKNPTIVVACSGGPDSMALLHLCISIREKYNLKIICAHVNHNVREESNEEEKYVQEFCNSRGVIFECMKIDSYVGDNFENEARIKRYSYFDFLATKYNANYLLTAHHGDDLTETVLMRITRGSTLKGYSGFSQVVNKGTYKILRPLIYCTKLDLLDYVNKNNIKYYIDKTNELDVHTRNRYRKYILPKLKEESMKVHEKFLEFSETLIIYDDFINRQIIDLKDTVYKDNIIKINEFKKIDEVLRIRIISAILEDIYQENLMLISDAHVKLIHNLIFSNRANALICMPNGINVVKEYDNLKFEKESLKPEDYEYELTKLTMLPNGRCLKFIEETDNNSNFICHLNTNDIDLPLIVRNRRIGDKMLVKGLNGTQKIKDILIDKKIPINQRDLWPIVTDSTDTIVWLPGLKKSQFDKKKFEKYDIIIKYD